MERYLVYFWATQCGQFVKIGHCHGNLYERRVGISIGCPLPLCEYPSGVIVCEDKADMLKVENAHHNQFKAYQTNGEWFELPDEISEYIKVFTDTESSKRFMEEDRERKNKRYRERQRERYHNDPEVRERALERSRESRKAPEYRERKQKYDRERHHNDPEYRERQQERQRESRKAPEYRERKQKYDREYRARKKRERQQISGQQLMLTGVDDSEQ